MRELYTPMGDSSNPEFEVSNWQIPAVLLGAAQNTTKAGNGRRRR